VLWGGGLVAYNIHVEANRRGVSWRETGLVDTAMDRYALKESFNEQWEKELSWGPFLRQQMAWVGELALPAGQPQAGWGKVALWFVMVTTVVVAALRADPDRRMLILLIAGSGYFLVFPLRNFAAFHDFARMFYIGLPLMFYATLGAWLARHRVAAAVWLTVALAVFTGTHIAVSNDRTEVSASGDVYTHEFQRIADGIEGEGRSVYVDPYWRDLVPGVPYACGFYLAEHYITPPTLADYFVSTNRAYMAGNLTPANQKVFLFTRQR
jgi:hypothetical protein